MENNDSTKLLVEQRAREERERSDSLYAVKIVERIVFTIVGIASLASLYALLKIVVVTPVIQNSIPGV